MVELRRDVAFEGPVVTGFTAKGYKVGDQRFDQGLLLSPYQALSWNILSRDQLDVSKILAALDLSPAPEFILLGSGPNMLQPPGPFRNAASALDIGIEVMDSRAAAKTWGVLRAEERWIIGAIMPLN